MIVDFATQPLPEHEPHIKATSDQEKLPGFWVAPFVAEVEDLEAWEDDPEGYDYLMVFFHGGAFGCGHGMQVLTCISSDP